MLSDLHSVLLTLSWSGCDEAFSHLVSDGVISDPCFNLSRAMSSIKF